MSNTTLAIVAVACLGAGFLVGSMTAPEAETTSTLPGEVADLRAQVARLEAELGRREVPQAAGAALAGRGGPDDPAPERAPAPPAAPAPTAFDVTAFTDSAEAFASLLAYAKAMLAKGPEGHLALLRTLNDTFFEDPGRRVARELVGSEEEAVRFLYPVIKFAMDHDVQVADMMETIYKTGAEDPARLEGLDDDALELFTEGIAYVLPGMVGADRMQRMSKYAEAILAQDAATQPEALRRTRRDVEQALRAWRPPLAPEEALAKLRSGTVSPEEMGYLMRRVPPEMLATLDLDALIGPLLERNPYQVMSVLHRAQPRGAVRDRLDQRVIRGVLQGTGHPQFLHYYLRYTGRTGWAEARPFFETGLQQAATPKAAGVFVQAAVGTGKGPDAAWAGWALETYELEPAARKMLEVRLK